MSIKRIYIFILGLIVLTTLFMPGCAELNQLIETANVREPDVKVADVKIGSFTFKKVNLVFDIDISNPNSLGIDLNGFDYNFLLNDHSFLKGEQNQPLKILANGKSSVKVPVSLTFDEVYKAYKNLVNQDSIHYSFKSGLKFKLPILGVTRIPVSKSGTLPNVKIPAVSLRGIKLNHLGFTSADLEVEISVKNPNNFGLNLDHFNYHLNVAGQEWVTGIKSKEIQLSEKKTGDISIPVSLNFLQMGQSILNILTSDQALNYQFSGSTDILTTLPLLEKYKLQFKKSGQTKLLK